MNKLQLDQTSTLHYKFALYTRAVLDKHLDGPVVNVQGVLIRVGATVPNYEVSYIHNGVNYEIWVAEYRLTQVDAS